MERCLQFFTNDETIRLSVFLACLGDNILWQLRRRRLLVPTDFGEVVPDELLIETLLRFTGFIEIRGPETGGVRCEDFINDNQFSIAPVRIQIWYHRG